MNDLEQNLLYSVVGLTMLTSLVIIIVRAFRRRGDDRRDRKPWDDLEPK
ncbi:hypothetical protein [Microbacterium oleivorans]|nr:hypothetical protein [Microbacterium oleivorans]MCM3697636.1 hypothetical protein [Microbacterium oleivorans]